MALSWPCAAHADLSSVQMDGSGAVCQGHGSGCPRWAGLGMTVGLLELFGAVTQLSSSLEEPVDNSMLHSIETIVIDWSHQIREILNRDSAQPLLEGLHPLPRAEFEFWRTRSLHLQCINEQVWLCRGWPGCFPT